MVRTIVFAICIVFSVSLSAHATPQFQSSIAKIYTVQDNPSYLNPWNNDGPESISGSGAVISDNRIITNAHVVTNNTFIQVRAHGQAKKVEAEVIAISHEADLALLRVKEPSFFEGMPPLKIGDLPEIQQPIAVCGFPEGGDTLSMTTGIVSRIEHQLYAHSYMELFAIQIDAAINSGNSGGPALSEDGEIVGIAMQGMVDADNIAYLIPPPVIRQFLQDVEDGNYSGIPALGIQTQAMENPSLRKKSRMGPGMTGCLVARVAPGGSADGYLNAGDVLLKINGHDIADDTTIEFRPQERTSFAYGFQHMQLGDVADFEILRGGKRQTASVPLQNRIGSNSLVKMQYDQTPTYYIYGGLVFNPLTFNFLQCWGEEWDRDAPNDLLSFLYRDWKKNADEEVIVLNSVLPSDVNIGYHDLGEEFVVSLNGKKINNMREFIGLIESDDTDYVDIVLSSNRRVVLDKEDVRSAGNTILERYKVPKDRSGDLVF